MLAYGTVPRGAALLLLLLLSTLDTLGAQQGTQSRHPLPGYRKMVRPNYLALFDVIAYAQ
jgi:hypothetical protein